MWDRHAAWRRLQPLLAPLLIMLLLATRPFGLTAASPAPGRSEELLMQPLPDGSLLAHFEFGSAARLGAAHAGTFPPLLLGLVERLGVQHLDVSLTRGRWPREALQPGPAAAAASPKPAGLELKVSFQPWVEDTQAAYAELTQTLGGLLCAGAATAPQLAVMAVPAVGWWTGAGAGPWAATAAGAGEAAGAAAGAAAWPAAEAGAAHGCPAGPSAAGKSAGLGGSGGRQVYAWLPQESLCTENLAAWRRLLPCRHRAGLAALLRPLPLAAASYQSLGLQLWAPPACPSCSSEGSSSSGGGSCGSSGSNLSSRGGLVQLRQVLTAVLPGRADLAGGSVSELLQAGFGAGGLPPACPAAASSAVYVANGRHGEAARPGRQQQLEGSSSSCRELRLPAGEVLACDVGQGQTALPDSAAHPASAAGAVEAAPGSPPALQVVQHLVQQGSQAGTLVVGVRLPAAAATTEASGSRDGGGSALLHVMQLLPWQLLVEAPRLEVRLDGKPLRPGTSPQLVWQAVYARPDRTAVVELLVRLPAQQAQQQAQQAPAWHELVLSVPFRAAFVGVFDHAPDASRGVDVPPALATLLPPACANLSSGGSSQGQPSGHQAAVPPLLQRLRGDCGARQAFSGGGGGGLVALPLPDFSMPFNVICFSSTLLAVLVGGTANAVLRSPKELAGKAAASGASAWRRKLRRMLALLLLMAAVAVYLDRDLQRQLDGLLHRWVLGRHHSPELHGELR